MIVVNPTCNLEVEVKKPVKIPSVISTAFIEGTIITCAGFAIGVVGLAVGFTEALIFFQIKFLPDLAQRYFAPEMVVVEPAFEQLPPALVLAWAMEGTQTMVRTRIAVVRCLRYISETTRLERLRHQESAALLE